MKILEGIKICNIALEFLSNSMPAHISKTLPYNQEWMRAGMGTYANGIRIFRCSTDRISVRVRSPRDAQKRERESFSSSSQEASAQERERDRQREEENRLSRERERTNSWLRHIYFVRNFFLWNLVLSDSIFIAQKKQEKRRGERREERREEKRREERRHGRNGRTGVARLGSSGSEKEGAERSNQEGRKGCERSSP